MQHWVFGAFLALFVGGILLFPALTAWGEAWSERHQDSAEEREIDVLPVEEEWLFCSGFFAIIGAFALTTALRLPTWAGFFLVFVVWFGELWAVGSLSALGVGVIRSIGRRTRQR